MSTHFINLPSELLFNVLEELSYKDVLSCSMVCKVLHQVVCTSPLLQYRLELAISGLEDNMENSLATQTKRPLLRKYQEAWKQLHRLTARKSNTALIECEEGPVWELAGGVLGQSVGMRTVCFNQFGSKLRKVAAKEWRIEIDLDMRDFTMDPGQCLLVVLCTPHTHEGLYSVALLDMSTGKPHPCARTAELSLPFSYTPSQKFEIRVNGSLIGLLATHAAQGDWADTWSLMTVWNWKTGQEIYARETEEEDVYSFAWLSDKYLLLAYVDPSDGRASALSVIELGIDAPLSPQASYIFTLPSCQLDIAIIDSLQLLSDPGPMWTPTCAASERSHTDYEGGRDPPPFFVKRDERVITLMMTILDESSSRFSCYTIQFTLSTSKLLDVIRQNNSSMHMSFPWSAWGPQCTRAEPRNDLWDGAWPCCVYGTKIAARSSWVEFDNNKTTRYFPVDPEPLNHRLVMGAVEVHDFNQAIMKYTLAHAETSLASQAFSQELKEPVDYQHVKPLHIDGFDYYLQPTYLPHDYAQFFDDPDNVLTALPYRVSRTGCAPRLGSTEGAVKDDDLVLSKRHVCAVMLSEDSIVLVREWTDTEPNPDFLVIDVQ